MSKRRAQSTGAKRRCMTIDPYMPLGLILAGGLARRMGRGDKARIPIGGTAILERVLGRLKPQCSRIIINANEDPTRFADTGLPVVQDSIAGFAGPLAGILAGLDWAAAQAPEVCDILSVPGDCPFLPADLVVRLQAARLDVREIQQRVHHAQQAQAVAMGGLEARVTARGQG